jgi:hypothetical protein
LYNSSFIKDFTVVPKDTTASANPVTYTFTIYPYSKVAENAIIVVDIPPELEIVSSQKLIR